MANPQRGEVALTVGDRVYTLVLDFEALCQLEDVLSATAKPDEVVTANQALVKCLNLSYRHNRALFFAASRRHHPKLSLVECGDLIEQLGGVEVFIVTVMGLKTATEPDKEDMTNPPDARQTDPTDGIGAPTTSKPEELVLTGSGSGG